MKDNGQNSVEERRYPEQPLQVRGLLVSEVEKAVSWVVGVESEAGAPGSPAALDAHLEGLVAAHAELVFALGAGEVHATAPGKRVPEVAGGADDHVVLLQVALQAPGLVVWIMAGQLTDSILFC